MILSGIHKLGKGYQYLISIAAVCVVSGICYPFSALTGYRVVAYILLIPVSLIAVMFDILPVLVAALLSALIWDYFFIPPYFTFHVAAAEDMLLLVTYFVIATVSGILTYRIRKMEKEAVQREEGEKTLKLYNTLLNSLSHELRTPIATIVAATDNLQSGSAWLSVHDRDELVAEISKASLRLNEQVENLLNMSRLESGAIHPRMDWCDISEAIFTTVNQVNESGREHNISINVNPGLPLLRTDKGILQVVLYNILNNAVTHTPPGTRIAITATHEAGAIQIITEDNGPGFPADETERVFDKFYRLKNARAGGTGLGLSIVKGFTAALGGTVLLTNVPSGGARFTLLLYGETINPENLTNE